MQALNSEIESQPGSPSLLLSIHLLGSFRVHNRGKSLDTLNTARLQFLLAYLVLHRQAPISRQRLAFLFWPDSSEAQARTNLRNLLHKLRAALPGIEDYLHLDQHTLHWQNSSQFRLDVDEFLSLAGDVTSVQHLKEAVRIYAGDLMPDCYDDWIQPLRENLRQTFVSTLEKLHLLLAEKGSPREALKYAQLLLRHEPTREETYRHLMHLYAQCGDRAGVARTYQTCVTVLERELGLEPGPTTDKAYQEFSAQAAHWSLSPSETESLSQEPVLHNLPALLTSFIGRGQELEQVRDLLSRQRLLTLSGPGGIGKTRLALAAAGEILSQYRDGIFLVDLAPIDHPGMVTTAIADALHASDETRAAGLDGLIDLLRDQYLLLVLDNCEHLTEEVGSISQALLQACPGVRILATSRGVLNIYGETVWPVPALPTPARIEHTGLIDPANQVPTLRANESVQLFIERATSTLPTFRPSPSTLLTIAEICRHLEGMPLAIEMAAARVKTLTLEQIAGRLDNVLELLKDSSTATLPRRRTMEAVLDWSYSMLSASERELFVRLSVFSGHFSLQAAEKICQGKDIPEATILDLLASLVDKSLVENLLALPEARFRLHEIARQYARRKLEGQEYLRYWQYRHLEHFVQLAEQAEPKLREADQLEWLNRLDLEQENLRAALHLALEEDGLLDDGRASLGARLAGALWVYWFIRGHFSEGRRMAEQALALLDRTGDPDPALGKVLYPAASFALFQGDFARGKALSLRSLAVTRERGDAFGEVVSYHHFAMIANAQGDWSKAGRYYRRGLKIANRVEDPWLIGVMLNGLGDVAFNSHDHDNAFKFYQEKLAIGRQTGDRFQILYSLINLAEMALQHGDLQQAAMLTEEELAVSKVLGERRGISSALQHLGRIALRQRDYERAGELLKQSLQVVWGTRDRATVLESIVHLAEYEVQACRFEVAARLLAACDAALQSFPAGYRLPSQDLYERLIENVQAELETGVLTAVWTLGRLMNLEQAVSFALINHPSAAAGPMDS